MSRVYMKHTNKDGAVSLTEHECWDDALFRACRMNDIKEEKKKDGGEPCVEFMPREQFIAERGTVHRRAS